MIPYPYTCTAPYCLTRGKPVPLPPGTPITRGPYRSARRRRAAERARLVELARLNTRRLTGRDTY